MLKLVLINQLKKNQREIDVVNLNDVWEMYFDGSKCKEGNEVGIIFIMPNEEKKLYSMRLTFYYIPTMNLYTKV